MATCDVAGKSNSSWHQSQIRVHLHSVKQLVVAVADAKTRTKRSGKNLSLFYSRSVEVTRWTKCVGDRLRTGIAPSQVKISGDVDCWRGCVCVCVCVCVAMECVGVTTERTSHHHQLLLLLLLTSVRLLLPGISPSVALLVRRMWSWTCVWSAVTMTNWTSCGQYVDNVTSAVRRADLQAAASRPVATEPAFFLFLSNIAEPGVCLFGIAGNILNLIVLTRKQLQRSVAVGRSSPLCHSLF